jgi:hypothetical protein
MTRFGLRCPRCSHRTKGYDSGRILRSWLSNDGQCLELVVLGLRLKQFGKLRVGLWRVRNRMTRHGVALREVLLSAFPRMRLRLNPLDGDARLDPLKPIGQRPPL